MNADPDVHSPAFWKFADLSSLGKSTMLSRWFINLLEETCSIGICIHISVPTNKETVLPSGWATD